MAKRRRLTLDPLPASTDSPVLETKAFLRPDLAAGSPPIAQVAAEAAATAALRELSDTVAAVRAEGRLIARLPLDAIEADHLVRDRLETDEEALQALIASIRENGQRTPIEVADLGGGRYGLISGWRRLTALGVLAVEDARFGEVLALVRRPASAAEAYVAMVEENEVRLGLSHYERARIVARAADLGVFPSEKDALARLFANASRARRSKIGSFVTLYRALDGALRFPAALPERLGLQLARLEDGALAALGAALVAAPADTPEAEARRIGQALSQAGRAALVPAPEAEGPLVLRQPVPAAPAAPPPAEIRPGVFLAVTGGFTRPVLTLSGPGVDPVFRERLVAWLETGR